MKIAGLFLGFLISLAMAPAFALDLLHGDSATCETVARFFMIENGLKDFGPLKVDPAKESNDPPVVKDSQAGPPVQTAVETWVDPDFYFVKQTLKEGEENPRVSTFKFKLHPGPKKNCRFADLTVQSGRRPASHFSRESCESEFLKAPYEIRDDKVVLKKDYRTVKDCASVLRFR